MRESARSRASLLGRRRTRDQTRDAVRIGRGIGQGEHPAEQHPENHDAAEAKRFAQGLEVVGHGGKRARFDRRA